MTAKTSRIIIKTFVKTALKDADEAPERCTRNLVDMALHFSKGRFQISFFEMARTMLNNENSPYYPLIEDALKHMDKDKLIEFGLNPCKLCLKLCPHTLIKLFNDFNQRFLCL